jgi:uncharacterized protein YodC (DUF2158 family)
MNTAEATTQPTIATVGFQPGDVVQLVSGGPPMTVTAVVGDGEGVACRWFTAAGQLKADDFPPAALTRMPRQEEP